MVRVKEPLRERFERKVSPEPMSGCWLWTAHVDRYGYSQMWISWGHSKGTNMGAHRVAYELYKGPIPEGLQIDHKCRVRACVNPGHLEAVTNQVNTLRGETITARNSQKTHCNHGHPLVNGNLYKYGRRRVCRQCILERDRQTRREGK